MQFKKGDIILTRKIDGIVSMAIQELTGSNYSHVIMYIGGGRIIESVSGGGVILSSIKKYLSGHYTYKIRKLKQRDKIKPVIKSLRKRLGQSYSYWQNIFDLVLIFAGWILNKNLLKEIKVDYFANETNCTELVGLCLAENQIIIGNKHPSFLTPYDYEIEKKELI